MNPNNPFAELPSYLETPSRKPRIWILVGISILVIALILVGLYTLGANGKRNPGVSPVPTNEINPTSSPSEVPSIEPTQVSPTPLKKLDRADLEISVLNGSGETGAAKGTSSYLKGLGYLIEKTDNADDFSYKNLTVLISKKDSAFASLLKKDLESGDLKLPVTVTVSEDVISGAEVIVGK